MSELVSVSEWVNKLMSKWVSEGVKERVCEKVSERERERVRESKWEWVGWNLELNFLTAQSEGVSERQYSYLFQIIWVLVSEWNGCYYFRFGILVKWCQIIVL